MNLLNSWIRVDAIHLDQTSMSKENNNIETHRSYPTIIRRVSVLGTNNKDRYGAGHRKFFYVILLGDISILLFICNGTLMIIVFCC